MAHQAIVTLSSRTPGIVPATRILKLNPDHSTISIGRASRSVSKGLLSAEDNAWFDNPVMSRDHAELIFNQDSMSVMIKDIRSMHGTQLNDVKLPLNTSRIINNGDIVSFGAEVRRGQETFPPCRFHVQCEFVPWTRGFQFPDSDMEEESDEDEDICEDSQENGMTPIESPVPKKSISLDAIDLTKDDPEPEGTGSTASSVKEPSPEIQSTSFFVEEEAIIRSSGHLENPILLEDPESEDFEESSELNIIPPNYEESESSSSAEDSDKENDDNSREQEVNEESTYNWNTSIETSEISNGHGDASPHMFYDNKDIPVSSMRTTVGLLDDPAEISTSSRSMVDNELKGSFQDKTGVNNAEETLLPQVHEESRREIPFDKAMHIAEPILPLQTSAALAASSPPLNSLSGKRQPSPSDAAMPKSTKIPAMSLGDGMPNAWTTSPAQMQHHSQQNWKAGPPITQNLVEKAGKQEYFQAREINRARMTDQVSHNNEHGSVSDGLDRAKFNQLGHPYNPRPFSSAIDQSTLCRHQPQILYQPFPQARTDQECLIAQQLLHQRMAAQQLLIRQRQQLEATRSKAEYSNPQLLTQQRSFTLPNRYTSPQHYDFNANHVQQNSSGNDVKVLINGHSVSPQLDMTSAVRFNESKASAVAQKTVVKDTRSVVRIDDIVEPSDTNSNMKGLKRKADEISDVEEIRVWASRDASVPAANVESGSSIAMVPLEHINTREHTDATHVCTLPATVETAPHLHPSKKIKRFAEAVGYAALGGIAVGAGLFSILVATAPDFS